MKTIYEYKMNENEIFNELHEQYIVYAHRMLTLPVMVYQDKKHTIELLDGIYLVRDKNIYKPVACSKSLAELKEYITK